MKIINLIILISIILGLSICSADIDRADIIGTWAVETDNTDVELEYYTFNSDGTLESNLYQNATWGLLDNRYITLIYNDRLGTERGYLLYIQYLYNNVLILTDNDGTSLTFRKQ